MIKILHVIDGLNAGGMESMLMNYYRHLDKKKYKIDFLVFHKEKCFFEDEIHCMGGNIYKITPRRENPYKNRKEVKEFFKKNKYDIIEFHQGITYFYPLIMAKKYGNSIRIIHNHGINRKYLKNLKLYNNLYARKRISNLGTHYFTCSMEVNNQLFSNNVIQHRKIFLINNAIDIEKYSFSMEDRKNIRKEFGIDNEIELLCHIGTFTEPKNHKFLLDIFAEYIKMSPKSLLMLVGTGILEEKIINRAKELGIIDRIILTGNRKDIEKILSASDKLVFPSLYEGIPLVLIEAQSSGLPIFISNTINQKCFVTNNGLVLELESSPKVWAERIYNYKNNSYRNYYNKKMRESQFNIVNEAKKLDAIYSNIGLSR